VSFPNIIKPIIDGIAEDDSEKLKKFLSLLGSGIVHELVHLERDDGLVSQVRSELASHVLQFLFDPPNNKILNDDMEKSLEKFAEARDDNMKTVGIYETAHIAALSIIADRLAIQQPEFKQLLQRDTDPNKVTSLNIMIDMFQNGEGLEDCTGFLAEIIELASDDLIRRVKKFEDNYGVQESIF
jgi:hypothetical protein